MYAFLAQFCYSGRLDWCIQDPSKFEDECETKHILELEPKNIATYVLMSNIYAMTIWWDVVANMRQMMKNKGIQKFPYSSWIQVNNKVHAFLGGDISHSETQHIYGMVEGYADGGGRVYLRYQLYTAQC